VLAPTDDRSAVAEDVDEPVVIAEPDEGWPDVAARLADQCRRVCSGEAVLEVEHVGSTAVRGLAAKPVVDLLAGVRPGRRRAVAAALASAGWTVLGEAGVPGREYLRRRTGQHANVHVVEVGSRLWLDALLLRDHLRRDDQARARYEAAKRLAAREAPTLLAYSAAKSGIAETLLAEARRG
jgi:GrpB-like predicted nucleotidyltransferase (UPF0157 family)